MRLTVCPVRTLVTYSFRHNAFAPDREKLPFSHGLNVYPKIIKKAYHIHKQRNPIRHHVIRSTEKGYNWKIERLHGNIRERTKIMRQFNRLESARAIMKGWEIFYNFCRKHQGIKEYPYEKATDLKLGENKWLDLIKLAYNSA